MFSLKNETFPLSLYTPIEKSSLWRFQSITAGNLWTSFTFNDALWTDYTPSNVAPTPVAGPHYYRHSFVGIANMAAFDLRLKYRYGIVAYINGKEMWRDNMGDGVITAESLATGTYPTEDYRGVVRSAADAEAAESVLAVEIHFNAVGTHNVTFDAFMALLAPSIPDSRCAPFYVEPIVSSVGSWNDQMINWYRSDYFSGGAIGSGLTISMTYSGLVVPLINGMDIYPHTYKNDVPRDYVLSSASSISPDAILSTIVTGNDIVYETKMLSVNAAILMSATPSTNYRLVVTTTGSGSLKIAEMQMLVCHLPFPTSIIFNSAVVEISAHYSSVDIRPILTFISGCSIHPDLPSGLALTTDCHISGVSNIALAQTVFTVSTLLFGGISGTVTLTVTECSGSMIELRREYKSSANMEGYEIRDSATESVLFSKPINGGQKNEEVSVTLLCVSVPRISVELTSSVVYWPVDSWLYISLFIYGDKKELIHRSHYDSYLGLSTSIIVDINYILKSHEIWYFKFDSIPVTWYSSNTVGFEQKIVGEFPAATGRIQLYKKTVTIESLTGLSAAMIGLRYRYGCIIYLNDREVFRNHISDDLTTDSSANGSYSNSDYHFISLPFKTISIGTTPSVDYIIVGANTIAVALISIAPTQTTTEFDCVMRLVADSSSSRIVDYTVSGTGFTGLSKSSFDQYYSTYMASTLCSTNNIQITFNNDRREWVSSFMIQNYYAKMENLVRSFTFEARNAGDPTWTTLKTVTGLTWSTAAQKRKIWVENNKPYNQYRWSNFSTGDSQACSWKVQELDLFCDDTSMTIPPLTYEPTVIFKDIEMAELYPNSAAYTDFTVTPQLPVGIVIDPVMGIVSGTAKAFMTTTSYVVSARKVTGGTVTSELTLTVERCHGGRNLITYAIKADAYPQENSYRLYTGRDVTGTPFKTVAPLPVASDMVFVDVCMPHGIYTFKGTELWGDGWNIGSGVMMTIDQGTLIVNMMTLPACTGKPCHVMSSFSTLMPFQINYEDWRVLTKSDAPTGWKDISFNDNEWRVTKATAIGTNSAITTYLRRSFTIPSLADYHVMNAHIKYTGGVVAYFNGNIVARFNMPDTFNSNTESLTLHDTSKYSAFHVILIMAGAVNGTNVMAFEVHRPVGGSSADTIVFDASAVFGVEDCSIVVDSYIDITGSVPYNGELSSLLDLNITTSGSFKQDDGEYIAWTVENQEGSKFNKYGFVVSYSVKDWGFSMVGRSGHKRNSEEEEEDYTVLSRMAPVDIKNRVMTVYEAPVGVASFRQFKWISEDAPSSNTNIYSLFTMYCRAMGNVCHTVDGFPTVSEGQISPVPCPVGFMGYQYRKCEANGVFGELKSENCIPRVPSDLRYLLSRYLFVRNTFVTTGVPTYENLINKFYVDEHVVLPDGLLLNAITGEISGTPLREIDNMEYVIFGANTAGVTSFTVTISVRKGSCPIESVWPKTDVNTIARYECALQGSYIGSMMRECNLGEKDGVWGKASGVCISVATIVVLIVLAIIIVTVVIFVIVRSSMKTRAVGGIRGKKPAKPGKKPVKPEEKNTKKIINVITV